MKVRFTQTRVVADEHEGTDRETRFEQDRVYDLPEASAERWIARGVAVAVSESEAKPASAPAAAPAKPQAKAGSRKKTAGSASR
ncbi:hypothetical protein E5163_14880 [Marinicauda algicola]|uniref:Uncharacterized protein n=1 Tax=Marinicauda algicola TaxID=2029849 RepID=A0A4S2GW59_9PROT|nr:hypothetical protein [Marinicauda algicola]TGY87350.1 hypothetical protein E5163_14880 [Marinicauda algicola]